MHMRALALAAVAVCIGMTMGGVASARTWNDPAGRVTFDAPAGWVTSPDTRVDGFTYVITGNANNECHVVAFLNANTASTPPARIKVVGADPTRFTNESWTTTLNQIQRVFPGNSAHVNSTSADTSQFWPIQRAEVQGPERVVHAAMTIRPGVEIVTLCMTYDGAEPTATYDAFIRSVGHPNDATWQAAAEAAPVPATPAPAH
jgi:hypothetical protein